MIIGYIQNAPRFGQKEENFAEILNLSKGVRADLLVLPELFATGYTFTSQEEAHHLAENTDGMTADFMKQLSAMTGAVVVGGFIEQDNDRIFNSSLMVFGDSLIGTYRKIHLFNREKIWFTPGDKPLHVDDVNGMKIGMMICFDWMFPETARTLTLQGAQVIAHCANLVMPYCQTAMVTRCLENRVFAVTANRIGREIRGDDDFLFTGRSQITGVFGEVLSSAPIETTCAHTVEIDVRYADDKFINDYNDLIRDRRPDFYC